MSISKIDVRNVSKKLTHMEFKIIEAVKVKAAAGHDHLFIRLFIEEEISTWKKTDRYRNALTRLDYRSTWEMALMNGENEIALFKTIYL